ncbi:MAG: DUF3048 domain-containing protein [Microgenomates group bacterium]
MLDKISKIISSKGFMIAASFLGLYLLSTGASWAIFSYLKTEPASLISGGLDESRSGILDLPRTEKCPLNGGMFTKIEKDIWETRRPITTIIENHADARPQSGLSKADIVYEAVAEGGITRFLAIFYCGAAAEDVKIAPVRSARVYFIDWAAEFGIKPIFMHVGGANDYSGFGDTVKNARALELLETLGWRIPRGNDFDTTYDSGFPIFWRDYERLGRQVATEHTMVASLDAAYEQAEERGFGTKDSDGDAWDENFIEWKFADDSPSNQPTAREISFEFWSNKDEYAVIWKYDSESNSYLRYNDGSALLDHETKEQLLAKNVVILFVKETGPVDRNKHMMYTTTGEGETLIFQNGEVIEGTWEKDSRTDRTRFYDEEGKEISFVRGQIWIEAVPAGNTIDY